MTTLRHGEVAYAFIWASNYNRCCDVTSASLLLLSHFLLCVSVRPAVRQRPNEATQQAGGDSWRFYAAVSWDATIHHHTVSSQRDPPVGEWGGRETQSQQEKIGNSCTAVLRNQQLELLKSPKKTTTVGVSDTVRHLHTFLPTAKLFLCLLSRKQVTITHHVCTFPHFNLLIFPQGLHETDGTLCDIYLPAAQHDKRSQDHRPLATVEQHDAGGEHRSFERIQLSHSRHQALSRCIGFFLFQFRRNRGL